MVRWFMIIGRCFRVVMSCFGVMWRWFWRMMMRWPGRIRVRWLRNVNLWSWNCFDRRSIIKERLF